MKMFGRVGSLLGLLAVSGSVLVRAQAAESQGLHSLFVASGKLFFGTATDTNFLNDTAYQAIVTDKNEFGLHVPENTQKWEPTEPTEDKFVFTSPDAVLSRAAKNGQMFRCHTLTWHQQLPTFVTTTKWTTETLTQAIQTHITNVMTHYKGRCYSWDVVNEALADNGTLRNDVFSQVLGSSYIAISFAAAAAADPTAKLYYNDFNLETIPAKANAAFKIVQNLLNTTGVRIDGVGFQGHFDVGKTPTTDALAKTLTRFTDLGLEVAFSELDVRHSKLPPTDAALQQQAADYVTVVSACLAVPKCVGITVWEFTDKYSWIPTTFPGKGDACLYDANYTKKPAYTSVSSLLAAAATGGVTIGTGGSGGSNRSNRSTSTTVGSPASTGMFLSAGVQRWNNGLGATGVWAASFLVSLFLF